MKNILIPIFLIFSLSCFAQIKDISTIDSLNTVICSLNSQLDSQKIMLDSAINANNTIILDFKDWSKFDNFQSENSFVKDWLPSIIAIIVVFLTALGNLFYTKYCLIYSHKKEFEFKLKSLISEFEAIVYTTFGQMVSTKQIKKHHPDKVDIVDEFKTIFLNNSRAVKLLFDIKLLLNKDSKHFSNLNSLLDEYLKIGIVDVTGDEDSKTIEMNANKLIELQSQIKIMVDNIIIEA